MAMEQHPVPQNITTFQFRLIGDMTIKQFAYLAGGAIIAYIAYKLPLPFFITWPLAIFSALLGFGLAFVPVEERPMDVWILSFLKNTYNPTLFIWQQHAQETKKTTIIQPVPISVHPVATPEPQTADIHATPQETRSAVVVRKPDIISSTLNSLIARVSSFSPANINLSRASEIILRRTPDPQQ